MGNSIEKRIMPDISVSEELYISGLLDVTSYLCSELTSFLIEEERYVGITKSFMHSINDAFISINKDVEEDDIDIYEKILFLYKPIIVREFNRLKSKSLSPGDSTVIIIKKIIEIVSGHEYKHNRELRTIRKVINKFFDNIKNRAKKDPLYNLSNTIKTYMEKGAIGKYSLDHISLKSENAEKQELVGTGIRINEETDNKITEVTWKDE